jgi:hypothetical protein
MTSLATAAGRAAREKELYPPITHLFSEGHFEVWEQATIRAGDEGTKTADHVAWRWQGDEIDACAVEVKAGNADVGFAQAVAYEVGFSKVYVAAEDDVAETGYLAKVFDRLGLGYISVSPAAATIELEAKPSEFISQPVHDENLGRIRLRHLFTESLVGEAVRASRDQRGEIWAVTGTTSEWQVCGQVITGSECMWLSLLAEGKSIGVRAAALRPERLIGAIEALPGCRLVLRRREHKGFRPVHEDLAVWRPADGPAALDSLLRDSRALSVEKNVGPQFQIISDFWPHEMRLAEDAARTELAEAVTRLRGIRDRLNA